MRNEHLLNVLCLLNLKLPLLLEGLRLDDNWPRVASRSAYRAPASAVAVPPRLRPHPRAAVVPFRSRATRPNGPLPRWDPPAR